MSHHQTQHQHTECTSCEDAHPSRFRGGIVPTEAKPLTYEEVNTTVLAMLEPPTYRWWLFLALCLAAVAIGGVSWTRQILNGMTEAGKSHPDMWGGYITTFVF